MRKKKIIIGIDEVGRGPLAGPVFVVAVGLPNGFKIKNKKLGKLADSKKLSPKARERWFEYFQIQPEIKFAVTKVGPKIIDKINISRAANLAALRAFKRLTSNLEPRTSNIRTYLDGGLFLGNHRPTLNQHRTTQKIPGKSASGRRLSATTVATTVVRGDEKIKAVMVASIIAKVKRDSLMRRLAKKYPRYGFEIHKGYGTRAHLAAIKKYGPSEIHRRSFLKFLKKY